MEDDVDIVLFLIRTATQTDYPATFYVYTVWIGARATNIQVNISSSSLEWTILFAAGSQA